MPTVSELIADLVEQGTPHKEAARQTREKLAQIKKKKEENDAAYRNNRLLKGVRIWMEV
jgi:hypothetical protein